MIKKIEKFLKGYKTATFSLDADIVEELQNFSIQYRMKKTEIVEEALKEYIRKHKRQINK